MGKVEVKVSAIYYIVKIFSDTWSDRVDVLHNTQLGGYQSSKSLPPELLARYAAKKKHA